MKSYFYKLLHRYVSLIARPFSSVVEVTPRHGRLIELMDTCTRFIYTPDPSQPLFAKSVTCLHSFKEIAAIKPDCILLNGNLHYEADIHALLENLREASEPKTRIIILYYSALWRPLIRLATALGLRQRTPEQNWLAHEDVENFLHLTGFEKVSREFKVLCPVYIPVISSFVNRLLAPLPLVRHLTMVNLLVARPLIKPAGTSRPSVSIIVAARNEAGTIEELIRRIPAMGPDDELIFIEGHSTDDTALVIDAMAKKYAPSKKIIAARQPGKGKGDAVRLGFSLASGYIMIILDADLSVAPEDLLKVYRAIIDNKGELVNGSRLVYPMDAKAMRFWNMVGNKFFAAAFSFVIGQRFKDTLCGTKALGREKYLAIARNRDFFGDFDPFGDFDLLFGAAGLGMKIVELPLRYYQRTYGTTNIKRWQHGMLLFRMLLFAARKIKFL
ncbi:MAG TPA: glycosyltransferase family 2 protein [Chitinivibrionales bacterium]